MTTAATDSGTVIEVARDVAEVEALRASWQAAEIRNVDSDIDYFLTVVEMSPYALRPHVVRCRRPGRPDQLGIARIEQYELPLRIARHTLAVPRLRAVVVTFGGIVGVDTQDDAAALLDALYEPVRRGEADALVLRDLAVHAPVMAAAHHLAAGRRVYGMPVQHRWLAERPASLEEFLKQQSYARRKDMRRCLRRLDAGAAGVLHLRRASTPEDGDGLVRDIEQVAAIAYQRRIETGFVGHALTEALVRLGLERGWFRAWVLYLDQRPVAFWAQTKYAGVFGGGSTAYDPSFQRHSVGQYCMLRMIEDIATDDEITLLDLGHGDFDYKQKFMSWTVPEKDAIIVAARPRPVALAGMASVSALVNRWGKAMLSRRDHARTWLRARTRRGAAAPSPPAESES